MRISLYFFLFIHLFNLAAYADYSAINPKKAKPCPAINQACPAVLLNDENEQLNDNSILFGYFSLGSDSVQKQCSGYMNPSIGPNSSQAQANQVMRERTLSNRLLSPYAQGNIQKCLEGNKNSGILLSRFAYFQRRLDQNTADVLNTMAWTKSFIPNSQPLKCPSAELIQSQITCQQLNSTCTQTRDPSNLLTAFNQELPIIKNCQAQLMQYSSIKYSADQRKEVEKKCNLVMEMIYAKYPWAKQKQYLNALQSGKSQKEAFIEQMKSNLETQKSYYNDLNAAESELNSPKKEKRDLDKIISMINKTTPLAVNVDPIVEYHNCLSERAQDKADTNETLSEVSVQVASMMLSAGTSLLASGSFWASRAAIVTANGARAIDGGLLIKTYSDVYKKCGDGPQREGDSLGAIDPNLVCKNNSYSDKTAFNRPDGCAMSVVSAAIATTAAGVGVAQTSTALREVAAEVRPSSTITQAARESHVLDTTQITIPIKRENIVFNQLNSQSLKLGKKNTSLSPAFEHQDFKKFVAEMEKRGRKVVYSNTKVDTFENPQGYFIINETDTWASVQAKVESESIYERLFGRINDRQFQKLKPGENPLQRFTPAEIAAMGPRNRALLKSISTNDSALSPAFLKLSMQRNELIDQMEKMPYLTTTQKNYKKLLETEGDLMFLKAAKEVDDLNVKNHRPTQWTTQKEALLAKAQENYKQAKHAIKVQAALPDTFEADSAAVIGSPWEKVLQQVISQTDQKN